jgi:hypothetical protein
MYQGEDGICIKIISQYNVLVTLAVKNSFLYFTDFIICKINPTEYHKKRYQDVFQHNITTDLTAAGTNKDTENLHTYTDIYVAIIFFLLVTK